ncbi:MAG TPA: hypothetical protein VGZ25_07120, partial [Gemmataceae bacterium]|nr:hypothetical protein [Gemmataceae bacterium]
SEDTTWPSWAQVANRPTIQQLGAFGNLDTIHGLAHSFTSPESSNRSFATKATVQTVLEEMTANRLVPPVFTSHGGGEGVLIKGQLTTAEGLAIYPERGPQALDSPQSPYYVLPVLKSAGVYFYNPLDVIFTHSLVRMDGLLQAQTGQDDSPYYAFSRYFPKSEGSLGHSPLWAHGKHAATAQAFPTVVRQIIREMRHSAPGSGCVIYTHLGNRVGNQTAPRLGWPEEMHQTWELLAEYFAARDKDNPLPCRIWWATTASVLAYAALHQGLAAHLDVADNQIRIRSWEDPTLGVRIPDPATFGTSWLQGVTVYVSNTDQVSVSIDELLIPHFTRNAPDATGRPSITLVDASHSVALLPSIPEAESGDCLSGLITFEVPEERAPLEIICSTSKNPLKTTLPVAQVPSRNATHWTFEIYLESPDICWSLGFQTESGDWFLAGNHSDMSWEVPPTRVREWQRVTLPLYDSNSCVLPHGRIQAVQLSSTSLGKKVKIKFRDLAILRPRPAQRVHPTERILSGIVSGWPEGHPLPGISVKCQYSETVLQVQTDRWGQFLFSSLPDKVRCRLSIDQPGKKAVYTRGVVAHMTSDQWDWDIFLV